MSHRVNVLLDDTVWAGLSRTPKGERSRVVNQALETWFRQRRRREAARRMDEARADLAPVPTSDIVRWLREDRERGQ